ncbi:hypothetical protein [Flagellimonas onchidii]|uniref:hypothetical protein n=1 Tax=Flagellimonas onchidii TaxID=2562684 RepID=UPI0010A5BB0E|nr:hypothetical protein [Allomuricauda onchidii]
MRIIAFLFITFFYIHATIAQTVEDHQLTINALLPGVVYEHGISKNSTLAAEATIGFALIGGIDYGIYPIGRLEYRHYYNMQRRLDKGKRISGNSGNYLAPTLGFQSGKAVIGDLDYASDFFAAAGVVYGLQRVGRKGLCFRFEVGPAYFFDEFDNNFGLFTALKLGWVVNKRN